MSGHIAVVGAGSWGTAIAWLLGGSRPVTIWARRDEQAEKINDDRVNPDYLSGTVLPPSVSASSDLAETVKGAEVTVMAVPSHGFRAVFSEVAPALGERAPVVSLTKGIEQSSLQTMTQVMAEVMAEVAPRRRTSGTGVLTGPNLAGEVAAGQPTASVVAAADRGVAARLQELFMGPGFRVYTNDDVIGCELAGALKNVMAIASGMSDGLGFGDNTRAALITRALAELTRLGVALGGRPETFAGLAGTGDLVATCCSPSSRNHRVGVGLASGRALDDVTREMGMVAEGVKTTRSVLDLAGREGVEMPIAEHVGQVLYEGMHPREAVMSLMTREAKAERA